MKLSVYPPSRKCCTTESVVFTPAYFNLWGTVDVRKSVFVTHQTASQSLCISGHSFRDGGSKGGREAVMQLTMTPANFNLWSLWLVMQEVSILWLTSHLPNEHVSLCVWERERGWEVGSEGVMQLKMDSFRSMWDDVVRLPWSPELFDWFELRKALTLPDQQTLCTSYLYVDTLIRSTMPALCSIYAGRYEHYIIIQQLLWLVTHDCYHTRP